MISSGRRCAMGRARVPGESMRPSITTLATCAVLGVLLGQDLGEGTHHHPRVVQRLPGLGLSSPQGGRVVGDQERTTAACSHRRQHLFSTDAAPPETHSPTVPHSIPTTVHSASLVDACAARHGGPSGHAACRRRTGTQVSCMTREQHAERSCRVLGLVTRVRLSPSPSAPNALPWSAGTAATGCPSTLEKFEMAALRLISDHSPREIDDAGDLVAGQTQLFGALKLSLCPVLVRHACARFQPRPTTVRRRSSTARRAQRARRWPPV